MIKKGLKKIAKTLLVIAVIFTLGCVSVPTRVSNTGIMTIKNSSDCLLFAVTIGKMTLNTEGLYDFEFVFGEWIPVGKEVEVELVIGQEYAILIESYYFSKEDSMEATEHVADIYKSGIFKGKEDSLIELHCTHSVPKSAAVTSDSSMDGRMLSLKGRVK